MSHEILYTSAPQGLKPGSRGFCTVVRSEGISNNLAEHLESFSGYRHAFMAHDASRGQNPVNYAHFHTTLGGRRYHVLSRIADAGLDYTQRTNKLAHHVALEPSEVAAAPGGPAWTMASEGFFVGRWDGQLRTTAGGRRPPGTDRPAAICQRWEQLTGDAGWGGVLAESGWRKGSPMSVIFPVGTPTLELVIESLSLLPSGKRWEVTFSTYFIKAPAGVDCQWRFLLDGTPEAAALRRDVRAAIIDLTKPLGRASGAGLVDAARTGVVAARPAPRVAAAVTRPERPRTAGGMAAPRGNEPDEPAFRPPAPRPLDRGVGPPPAWNVPASSAKSRLLLLIAFGGGFLLMALGILVGAMLFGGCYEVPRVEMTAGEPEGTEREPESTAEPVEVDEVDEALPREDFSEEPVDEEPAPEATVESPDSAEPSAEEEVGETPPADPFADLRDRQYRLRLPPNKVTKGGGALAAEVLNKEIVQLARLDVLSSQDCDLQVVGSEFRTGDGREPTIDVFDEGATRRWQIVLRGTTTFRETKTPIATLRLEDGALQFNWETKNPAIRLNFCALEITAHGQTESGALEFPVETGPSLQLSPGVRELADLRAFGIRRDDDVEVDFQFHGIEGADFANVHTLNRQLPKATISVPVPALQDTVSEASAAVELTLREQSSADEASEETNADDLGMILRIDTRFRARAWRVEQSQNTQEVQFDAQNRWERTDRGRITLSMDQISAHQEAARKPLEQRQEELIRRGYLGRDWQNTDEQRRKEVVRFVQKENERDELQNDEPESEEAKESWTRQLAGIRNELDAWPEKQEMEDLKAEFRLHLTAHLALAQEYNLLDDWLAEIDTWSEGMRRLLQEVHHAGRLDYRVYLRIDDREVDLALSEGYRRTEEPES